MKHRTLQLFQLFLLILAFYLPLKYGANQRLFLSLACLTTAFMVGKVETSVAKSSRQQSVERNDKPKKKDENEGAKQALDWLLKSKNLSLITDAIQYLFQDLGLIVSPSLDYPGIDRLLRIPGTEVTWGLKILGDVADLDENWNKWEEIAGFDQGQSGKQRLLVIGSNCTKAQEGAPQQYRRFSTDAQGVLATRQVVAMTTLTLGKIYVSCKKKKADISKIFQPIEHHPGGIFHLPSV